jgi:glucose uptake protein
VCGAILAVLLVTGSPARGQVGPVWISALGNGAPLLALLFGAAVLGEFKDSSERIRTLLWATAVLYAAGLAMVSIAPLYRA